MKLVSHLLNYGDVAYQECEGTVVDFSPAFPGGEGCRGAVFFWTCNQGHPYLARRRIDFGVLFGAARPHDGSDNLYPHANPPLDQSLHRAFLAVCAGAPPEPFLDLLVDEYPELETLVNKYLGV